MATMADLLSTYTTQSEMSAFFIDKMGIINVKSYGATGDGSTDDTEAIQDALDAANTAGGGIVFVPTGHYIITKFLKLYDNTALIGVGYASWIDNTTISGFDRVVIATGNIGDKTAANGLYNETSYDIDDTAIGDLYVTLSTASEADNFSVGDIVLIKSAETWGLVAPNDVVAKYVNLNVITEISGANVYLRYPLQDAFVTSGTASQIAKLSGTITGYGNEALWMSRDCIVANLRLTHLQGQTSGWYGIFACGVGHRFENIWMDEISTAFGSNGLGHSIIRNVAANYDGGGFDLADIQVSNIIENCYFNRVGTNTNVNYTIGLSLNNGCDTTVKDTVVNCGGSGSVAATYVHRAKFDKCKVYDTHSTSVQSAISLGEGVDCSATNCIINTTTRHGMYIAGERAIARDNKFFNINTSAGSYQAIFVHASVNNFIIEGNIFDTQTARDSSDVIKQNTAASTSAIIRNNIFFDYQQPYAISASATTSSLTDANLRTYTIKGGYFNNNAKAFRIRASGACTGTNSTKTVKLKLGATVLTQIDYLAAETDTWNIEAYVAHDRNSTTVRAAALGYKATTMVDETTQDIAAALAADATLAATGVVANASDAVVIYLFVVEPIY